MSLTGHDRTLQQYWRADIAQVTGVTPGPQPDPADYPTITAGAGLTGGGDLSVSRTLAVGAGDGITVNADDVALASAVAGAGLTYTVGVLAVGAGLGLTVNADDVALTTPGSLTATSTNSSTGSHTHAIDSTIARSAITVTAGDGLTGGGDLTANRTLALAATVAGAGLTHAAGVLAVGVSGLGLSVAADAVTLTSSSNPGAAAAILATDASGLLRLVGLGIGAAGVANQVKLADAASLAWGDVVLSRVGANVAGLASGDAFETSYTSGWAGSGYHLDYNQSYANQSFLEIDRLSVRGIMSVYELLVHQIRATNGSIFVSSTAKAQSVIDNGGGIYTIVCETDHGFLAADLIRAQRFTGTGTYQCDMTVTNVLSSVQFAATLRATYTAPAAGMEFVRLGSTSDADRQGSIYLTADDTNAPYINILAGVAAFTDWGTTGKTKMRMGNLNGSYGVVANTFGVGIGQYGASTSNVLVTDAGISIVGKTVERIGLTAAGVLEIKDGGGNAVFTFDASTGAEFTKPLTLATTGGIYQGSGTFASPTTGLKLWNDTGVGRIAGYNAGTLQWGAATDGRIYAGAGHVVLHSDGVTFDGNSASASAQDGLLWRTVLPASGNEVGRLLCGLYAASAPSLNLTTNFNSTYTSSILGITAIGSAASRYTQCELNADNTNPFAELVAYYNTSNGASVTAYTGSGEGYVRISALKATVSSSTYFRSTGVEVAGGLNLGTATGAAAGKVYALLANAAGALEVARFGMATGGVAGSQDLVIGSYGASYGAGLRAVYDYSAATHTELALMVSNSGTLTEAVRIDNVGKVGILTNDPAVVLDINSDNIRMRTAKTPASAGAAGLTGQFCWDASYLYVAIGTNSWRRVAHAAW